MRSYRHILDYKFSLRMQLSNRNKFVFFLHLFTFADVSLLVLLFCKKNDSRTLISFLNAEQIFHVKDYSWRHFSHLLCFLYSHLFFLAFQNDVIRSLLHDSWSVFSLDLIKTLHIWTYWIDMKYLSGPLKKSYLPVSLLVWKFGLR